MDKITTHNMSAADLQDIKDKKKCYDGPITGNLKCIIITALFALFYWFAPKKNKYILVLLLYSIYLLIAWYDYMYDCQRNRFGPTPLRLFYEWAKPKDSKQSIIYSNLCPDKNKLIWIVDIVVLLLLIGLTPFFIKWKPSI